MRDGSLDGHQILRNTLGSPPGIIDGAQRAQTWQNSMTFTPDRQPRSAESLQSQGGTGDAKAQAYPLSKVQIEETDGSWYVTLRRQLEEQKLLGLQFPDATLHQSFSCTRCRMTALTQRCRTIAPAFRWHLMRRPLCRLLICAECKTYGS